MICPECNGRGETTYYYVGKDSDKNALTFEERIDICHTCNGSGKMPMTNADSIRAMSDEELAKYVGKNCLCDRIQDTDRKFCDSRAVCTDCIVEWLKQPAETENVDTCVCCGAIIPEGQMVCPNCLVTVKERR